MENEAEKIVEEANDKDVEESVDDNMDLPTMDLPTMNFGLGLNF